MRVLLVEDDEGIISFLEKGLREAKYALDVAQDGEDALYKASLNEYDAIILDIMIPGRDGLEVCRELRKLGSKVPVIMLTARDDVRDRVLGLDVGGGRLSDQTLSSFGAAREATCADAQRASPKINSDRDRRSTNRYFSADGQSCRSGLGADCKGICPNRISRAQRRSRRQSLRTNRTRLGRAFRLLFKRHRRAH
jgi:CheY-like chemotaxis protein